MCDDCKAKAERAATVVDSIVHAEKHTRALYPGDSNEDHCVRLAVTILESQLQPVQLGGMSVPAVTVENVQCLAMQYATTVQRLIALHEIAGIPLP